MIRAILSVILLAFLLVIFIGDIIIWIKSLIEDKKTNSK